MKAQNARHMRWQISTDSAAGP